MAFASAPIACCATRRWRPACASKPSVTWRVRGWASHHASAHCAAAARRRARPGRAHRQLRRGQEQHAGRWREGQPPGVPGRCECRARVNFGAGSITANYDGANKHRTVIGDDVHVGSNCVLVAPIAIGAGATIGGGSTLAKDAPAGQLSVARARQSTVSGWQRPEKDAASEPRWSSAAVGHRGGDRADAGGGGARVAPRHLSIGLAARHAGGRAAAGRRPGTGRPRRAPCRAGCAAGRPGGR